MRCLQGNNKQEEKHRQETHQFVKACKGQEDNFREQEKRSVSARIVRKK